MQFRERYDIVNQLGRGTTASVFFARDKHLNKHWAVKVFDTSRFQEKDWLCMENEILILQKVQSLQMPRIVDLYRENTRTCLVMDFMEGIRLDHYVESYGPVGEVLTIPWMIELCDILLHLHQMEPTIVYCDLKPENIILQKNGHLALVDLGSARQLCRKKEPGLPLTGTPGYTAPELFGDGGKLDDSGQLLDVCADVYSIGAVGRFLLTGMHHIPWQILAGKLSKGLLQVLQSCEAPPVRRFENCFALKKEMEQIYGK